ncbi:hypothetical protein AAFP35_24330 [Gordonia sp. CPCC 206044]|uniref:DUF6907 domain-containing protein n=1 Tax=Gordonia sp. CPCC 206044 TaxID=3140793 RepID=UPI003AF33FD5
MTTQARALTTDCPDWCTEDHTLDVDHWQKPGPYMVLSLEPVEREQSGGLLHTWHSHIGVNVIQRHHELASLHVHLQRNLASGGMDDIEYTMTPDEARRYAAKLIEGADIADPDGADSGRPLRVWTDDGAH